MEAAFSAGRRLILQPLFSCEGRGKVFSPLPQEREPGRLVTHCIYNTMSCVDTYARRQERGLVVINNFLTY